MRRRKFIFLAGAGLLGRLKSLSADSILISNDPRLTDFDLESVCSRYTPIEDFYVRDHFTGFPAASTIQSLSIAGEVARPLVITPLRLRSLKTRRLGAVLECAANGIFPYAMASNGLWEGWALHDILALAHPTARARFLLLTGGDGFRRRVSLGQVSPEALLATKLNHQPLTPAHGAPWRALFPGLYGMQSVKWLKRIELATEPLPLDTDEYAARLRGSNGIVKYQALPPVLVKSVITYPALGQALHPGTVTLRGLAWSGQGKVAVVEVSSDGGKTWSVAKLDPAGRYEWALWHYTVWIKGTGVAEFAVRAVDENGSEQPATRNPSRLDLYANNTIERVPFVVQQMLSR
jgi:DMSO/TMAO reductase YedYZ molybdopterin-dependent catalytic subunit